MLEEYCHIINANAHHVESDESINRQFWVKMDNLKWEIPICEQIFLWGGLNKHMVNNKKSDGRGHERQCIEETDLKKGKSWETLLKIALAFDLDIARGGKHNPTC